MSDGPSPIEQRALAHVDGHRHVKWLMQDQLRKGRDGYGHPIDDWEADPLTKLEETGREAVDLIVYLEAINAPKWLVFMAPNVAHWINKQIDKHKRLAHEATGR